MATSKASRNITLIGATGTVGAPILSALLAQNIHHVSLITRSTSNHTFPSGVTVHSGSYDDEAFLTASLQNQDVVIAAISYSAYDIQKPLARAAAAAGVKWIVPCEFGSDVHGKLNEHIDLMKMKVQYREYIEELGISSWIGVTCNPWFDFSLAKGLGFGIDLKGRTAELLDDGKRKANFSTLKRVGESVAAVLSLPEVELEAYRNGWIYTSSFHISQRDIIESAMRVTGTKESEWTITKKTCEDAIRDDKMEMAKGNMMGGIHLLFALVFSEGLGGDYNDKVLDYEKLGLKSESLDEVVKGIVQEVGA